MDTTATTTTAADGRARRRDLDRRINSRTGGALLVWIGAVLLASAGWGVGLIGAGAIVLAEQAVRRRLDIQFERSWVIAGLVAVGLGLAMAVGLRDGLVPVLLIVAGAVLIVSTFRR